MDDIPQENPKPTLKSQDEIEAWLVNQVAGLIYTEPDSIDVNAPFNSYGLSSRDAVMLSGDLEEWLDCRLSPTLVYEYPSIASLAEYLSSNPVSQEGSQTVSSPDQFIQTNSGAQQQPTNLDDRLDALEQITDEEAEALLLEKLKRLDPE